MRVVPLSEWRKDNYITIAQVDETAGELSRRFTIEFMQDFPDGLGESRIQFFELEDGRQFVIEQLLDAPAPYNAYIEIYAPDNPETMHKDLHDILDALDIPYDKVRWEHPDIRGKNKQGPTPAP